MISISQFKAVAASAVVVAGGGLLLAQGGLAGLGVSEADARNQAVYALAGGHVPIHLAAKAFKAAPAASRAALVRGALTWARAYLESPAFRADYEKRRRQEAPEPPKPKGTVEEEIAKQRAEQRKGIEEMKSNVSKMPPEMRKQMEETVRQMEQQAAQMEKDPQMNQMLRQGLEMQRENERREYEERLKRHEADYPADPNVLVARRLRQFLDVSKDVDFNAQLVPASRGKMRFADPLYESKPENWKLCFRAGKDVVEMARAFATEWLRQIAK